MINKNQYIGIGVIAFGFASYFWVDYVFVPVISGGLFAIGVELIFKWIPLYN